MALQVGLNDDFVSCVRFHTGVSLSSPHNNAEGRSILQIMEMYLDCLANALEAKDFGNQALEWGTK